MAPTETQPLTKYDVHYYAEIRQKFTNIEASSPREAVLKGFEDQRYLRWIQQFYVEHPLCVRIGEFAEGFSGYMVDVAGDTDYSESRYFADCAQDGVAVLQQLVAWAERQPLIPAGLQPIVDRAKQLTKNVV